MSDKVLEGALTDSLDVFQLFSGKVVVRTRLHLKLATLQGPQVEDLSGTPDTYTSLELLLPELTEYLDVPLYSLFVNEPEEVTPEVFVSTLNEVVDELVELELETPENKPKRAPGLLLKLLEAVSVMHVEQLKQVVPEYMNKELFELTPKEEVFR